MAMCDSLACPAGYEQRPKAFEKTCSALETCSLDVDLDRCCHRQMQWWTYMMAELAFFCVLSMLCSFIGGLVHHFLPSRSRRRSWHEVKKEVSKDAEEEESLHSPARSIAVKSSDAALPLPAMPSVASIPMVASNGSSFIQRDGSSFLQRPANLKTVYPGVPAVPAGFAV